MPFQRFACKTAYQDHLRLRDLRLQHLRNINDVEPTNKMTSENTISRRRSFSSRLIARHQWTELAKESALTNPVVSRLDRFKPVPDIRSAID